jgi:NOL1/NOP2/fmu family ribosome biogenesis protein
MADIEPLNAKQKKEFYALLHEHFETDFKFPGYLFVSQKNKYYTIDEKYKEVSHLKINTKVLGLYIAEVNKFGEIRLSIEGSQLVGPTATKHILELNQIEAEKFISGADIDVAKEKLPEKYHIIFRKTKEYIDYLGCGKVKDGILLNFTPKGRRVV